MKIAAIIPVKTFSLAKTRLNLSSNQKEDLCKIMLEEIVHTFSISPHFYKIIIVTKEETALKLTKKFGVKILLIMMKKMSTMQYHLLTNILKIMDMMHQLFFHKTYHLFKLKTSKFNSTTKHPPNFALVVPSRRFDGTNALLRMPVNLMETHYDEDSYKIHMNTAKDLTKNVALVFVKRIMLDIDNLEDLEFLLSQNEKPEIAKKIKKF